ncbi:MAG: hypothetical protein JKY62_11535 [Desulfocapsa sp.]|nr:hypothetical protein [Desulfocapsa sp.]
MKVTVHAIHFDADRDLVEFIQERVNKLEHFYDGIMGGEVFLRVEKSDDNQNKVAEIKYKHQEKNYSRNDNVSLLKKQ